MAIVFYIFLRNSPEEAGFPPVRDDGVEPPPRSTSECGHHGRNRAFNRRPFFDYVSSRVLWILGIGFLLHERRRYSS